MSPNTKSWIKCTAVFVAGGFCAWVATSDGIMSVGAAGAALMLYCMESPFTYHNEPCRQCGHEW